MIAHEARDQISGPMAPGPGGTSATLRVGPGGTSATLRVGPGGTSAVAAGWVGPGGQSATLRLGPGGRSAVAAAWVGPGGQSAAAFAAVPSTPSPVRATPADAANSASRFVMFCIELLLRSSDDPLLGPSRLSASPLTMRRLPAGPDE